MPQNYRDIIKYEIDDRKFAAGANMLVLKDGKEIIYEEYGYRDLENKAPFSRNTIMRLYSMSKPITSAAVMILVDRGLLDLADCLCWTMPCWKPSHWINEKGERVKSQNEIMIKDLMNMTSGLPYPGGEGSSAQVADIYVELDGRLRSDNPMTTREFCEKLGSVDLCFNPGDRFMYGTSADALGGVIENVTGMRFGEFLKENIFDPLGMDDTGFWVPAEKRERLAKVYRTNYAEWRVEHCPTNNLGIDYGLDREPAFESGGAGLVSTLDDYAKFAMMLMNGGELNGVRILSETAVKYMTSPSLSERQRRGFDWQGLGGYSYGNLMRNLVDPGQAVLMSERGEYGWDGWLGCFFANYPQSRMTILIGTQRTDCGTSALSRKLVNAVRRDVLG